MTDLNIRLERYERQIIDEVIGVSGQEKLSHAKVAVIGVGGLGSSVVLYLAVAGVGELGLVDCDSVQLSNLNRQVLYTPSDISCKKTVLAEQRVHAINPDITVVTFDTYVDNSNAEEIIAPYDIVIDATDNFDSKFMLNDICVKMKKPLIHAGAHGFVGQIMVITPESSCLRCFMTNIPDEGYANNNPRPIIGVTAGVLGQLQATETLKYIMNAGNLLVNKILFIDLLNMDFRKKDIPKNKACSVCS
ncbi:ThiF family adenylyltransferase [Candidatus Omnitrophota bacterium]